MKRLTLFAASAATLAVAGCAEPVAEDRNRDSDLEIAETDGEAEALARAIDPLDFDVLTLGAKIEGPQGEEPKTALSTTQGHFADMTSYVACAEGAESCVPGTAPEGTVYTYVHTVYPGEDNDPSTGSGEGADSSDIEMATGFMTTMPVYGFTGEAGYSRNSVRAATGETAEVVITCTDDGGLAWTLNAGDGGDQWEQAEPVTFWWRSTLPPAGLQIAYAIRTNAASASGPGPFPAASDGASNACEAVASTAR